MKKIINGKKYDTDTATLCGSYVRPFLFSNEMEHTMLYRKTNGEFFFFNCIGEPTVYDSITTVTEDKAKKWAENYLSVDDYENIFGEVSE